MQQAKYDTIYRRLFAKIFDYILLGIIIKIITLLLPETSYSFDFKHPNISNALVQNSNLYLDLWTEHNDLIVSFLLISYFVLFHFFCGQTIGKMITNVKVWNLNETSKINFLQAFLRSLSDVFFAIITLSLDVEYLPLILISVWTVANLIQVFSNKKFRTIDDLIAKTVVLKISNPESENKSEFVNQ